MNITVTVTASPELLAVLQTFADVKVGSATTTKASGVVKQMTKVAEATTEAVETTAGTSNAAEEFSPENTDKVVTIEEIRVEVQAKSQAGKKEKIKNLLGEFGVKNLTALAAEQYSDFYRKVAAI